MTFQTRILLALVAVGLAPALLVSGLSWRANREELVRTVGGAQREVASEAARSSARYVAQAVEGLRLAVDYIPFEQLAPEDLERVLRIPFRQLPGLNAIALLEAGGQAALAPLVREGARVDLGRFAAQIPLSGAQQQGLALGPPYPGEDGTPRLAVAVRLVPAAAETPSRVVAAELSLAEVAQRLEELARGGRYAALVGAGGEPVAEAGAAAGRHAGQRALVAEALSQRAPLVRPAAVGAGGDEWLDAVAPIPELGWGLVLAQPGRAAFLPAARISRYTAYWAAVAALLTLVLGVLLARGMSRPLAELSRAAEALGRGESARRADVSGPDELGRLARTFNAMADEIARREREARAWNEELQRRVEEKTSELRHAQDLIERSRRLSGLASMGAGIAHELNNPLTTIIGLLTLLREDLGPQSDHGRTLGLVLADAERIASIVGTFRRLTDKEVSDPVRVRLPEVAERVLARCAEELAQASIRVVRHLEPGVPEVLGDPAGLEEALGHVVRNAQQAMPTGGELALSVQQPERGLVRVAVSDTGVGIPEEIRERIFDPFFSTKPGGARAGMGLTLTHRIVQSLHGKIRVESTVGRGTTVSILLPAAAGAAHLR